MGSNLNIIPLMEKGPSLSQKILRGSIALGLFGATTLLAGCDKQTIPPVKPKPITPTPTTHRLIADEAHNQCTLDKDRVEVCADVFINGYAFSSFPKTVENPETGKILVMLNNMLIGIPILERYTNDFMTIRPPFYRFRALMDKPAGTTVMSMRIELGRDDEQLPRTFLCPKIAVQPGNHSFIYEWENYAHRAFGWDNKDMRFDGSPSSVNYGLLSCN
jgi:hypothetical protein